MKDDSWEILPKADAPQPKEQRVDARRAMRLALAFVVAGISDFLSAWVELIPPLQWALDLVTAGLLFLILGRQWMILPGLIAEAIPGVALFPFWVLVVGSISVWGNVSKNQS